MILRRMTVCVLLVLPLLATAWTGTSHSLYDDPLHYPDFVTDPAALIKTGMQRYNWQTIAESDNRIEAELNYQGYLIGLEISFGNGLISFRELKKVNYDCDTPSAGCNFDDSLYARWRVNLRRSIALEIHQLTINHAVNPRWTDADMAVMRLNQQVTISQPDAVDSDALAACKTDQQLLDGIDAFKDRLRFPVQALVEGEMREGMRSLDIAIDSLYHQDPLTIRFGGVPVTLAITFTLRNGDEVLYQESRSCGTTAAGSAKDENSFCEGYYQCSLSHGKYILKKLRRGPYNHLF